jgi:hypothetical protein
MRYYTNMRLSIRRRLLSAKASSAFVMAENMGRRPLHPA